MTTFTTSEIQMLKSAGLDPNRMAEARAKATPDSRFVPLARRRLVRAPWTVTALEEYGGAYEIVGRGAPGFGLRVIVTVSKEADGLHWLHVSFSREKRLPDYEDLLRVKREFVGPNKKAIMVFPSEDELVNLHPYCLHLFSPLEEDPLPDFTRGTRSL